MFFRCQAALCLMLFFQAGHRQVIFLCCINLSGFLLEKPRRCSIPCIGEGVFSITAPVAEDLGPSCVMSVSKTNLGNTFKQTLSEKQCTFSVDASFSLSSFKCNCVLNN